MFILMDGAMDAGLIEESQGVFSAPPNHIWLEIATRQQSVKQAIGLCRLCLLWMSGTQRYQIWCEWGFCLGNFANFFFLEKCILILFLHTYMGIKMSHHCKYVYYTRSIRSKRFFLFDTVMLRVNIYCFILKSKVMLPFFILIAFRSKYRHIP